MSDSGTCPVPCGGREHTVGVGDPFGASGGGGWSMDVRVLMCYFTAITFHCTRYRYSNPGRVDFSLIYLQEGNTPIKALFSSEIFLVFKDGSTFIFI